MDGVQFVLHNPQYITEYTWGWSWSGLSLLLLTAIFVKITLNFTGVPKQMIIGGAVIIAVTGIICSLFLFSKGKAIETYSHSEYEVVIHEGVDCKEFFETYEVVGQNGDLITIKERTNDDT
jgi:membrane protein YdbS with pleckstrin-like domain